MLDIIRTAISKVFNHRTWGDLITKYEKRSILSAAIISELKIREASTNNLFLDEIDGPKVDMKVIREVVDNDPDIGFLGFGREFECFAKFNICKYHATVHDACGAAKSKYDSGPGYKYANNCRVGRESPLLGHITGLFWCWKHRNELREIFGKV